MLQIALGLFVSLMSLSIVILDCFTVQGRIALAIIGGLLLVAWGYWLCLIWPNFAKRVYSWFNYDFNLRVHGYDDLDDQSRFCNFCDIFLRRNTVVNPRLSPHHRHPHYSYLEFPEIKVSLGEPCRHCEK